MKAFYKAWSNDLCLIFLCTGAAWAVHVSPLQDVDDAAFGPFADSLNLARVITRSQRSFIWHTFVTLLQLGSGAIAAAKPLRGWSAQHLYVDHINGRRTSCARKSTVSLDSTSAKRRLYNEPPTHVLTAHRDVWQLCCFTAGMNAMARCTPQAVPLLAKGHPSLFTWRGG